jgi:hypothetical protein
LDGKLEAIFGPDGRLAAVFDENGVNVTGFRPEYWHTDHPDPSGTGQVLGNVRLAFSDVNNNGRIEIEDDPGTPEDDTEVMRLSPGSQPGRNPARRLISRGREESLLSVWDESVGAMLRPPKLQRRRGMRRWRRRISTSTTARS